MARKSAGTIVRKAKHGDIAPVIRNAFKEGLGIYCRRMGRTVPEQFAVWIEEDWATMLSVVSKFVPKEKDHNVNVNAGMEFVSLLTKITQAKREGTTIDIPAEAESNERSKLLQ